METMIIFTSYLKKFEKLSDEQFGQLIKTGLKYSETGEVPAIDDTAVAVAFDVMKFEIDKNIDRYKEICEKRRVNGSKGGRAKAENAKKQEENLANVASASKSYQNLANDSNTKQELASASKSYQNLANDSKSYQSLANSSINKHKHKDKHNNKKITLSSERVTEKDSTASKASKATFSAPTLEEIKEYCSERKSEVDPETFFDYYEALAWEGIKDWKAKFRVWEKRETPKVDIKVETASAPITKGTSLFKQFAQRDYDFNELEAAIVNK